MRRRGRASLLLSRDKGSMRILMLHNHYQHRGGEDEIFAAEAGLLEAHGHAVDRFVLHNDSVPSLGLASVAAKTIWNQDLLVSTYSTQTGNEWH